MKNLKKNLSGDEKLNLAKDTLFDVLLGLGFQLDLIGEFLVHLYQRNNETLALLEKIEHGIDKYGVRTLAPTGQIVMGMEVWGLNPRAAQRSTVRSIQTTTEIIGQYFITRHLKNLFPGKKQEQSKLVESMIKDKGNAEALEVVQTCFLQIIAFRDQVDHKHIDEFRSIARYLRSQVEVSRMELHFSGQPTYPREIMHVDLFLKILEARVKVWDNAAKQPTRKRTK